MHEYLVQFMALHSSMNSVTVCEGMVLDECGVVIIERIVQLCGVWVCCVGDGWSSYQQSINIQKPIGARLFIMRSLAY